LSTEKKSFSKEITRGKSSKGQQTSLAILLAAKALLIDQGYHNFSLRKVANRAKLTLGNLQYYFPTKDSLIKAMLDHTIQRYLDMYKQIREEAGSDPEEQFTAVIAFNFKDLNTRYTTVFFPEVWSLANHEDHAAEFLDSMYGRYRTVLIDIMSLINPQLSATQLQRLAIFISASIEGHTIFVGNKKPWKKETENMTSLGIQSFLWLIHSATIPD
jgi:AcrR family transcriptional regulator